MKLPQLKKHHLLIAAVAVLILVVLCAVIGIFLFAFAKLNDLTATGLVITPTPDRSQVTNTPTITPSPTTAPTPTPDDNNFGKDYDYSPVAQKSGTVRIPVLVYHHISALTGNPATDAYIVTPETFDKQMAYLKAKNYKVITPKQFYDQVKSGKNPTQKEVLLTFDDSSKDHYQNAFPILKKYGFTGTFYVVVNKSGITKPQLREMANAGMIMDSHTMTHEDLSKITDAGNLAFEISDSKTILQNITGKTIYSLAYPGCASNAAARSEVVHAGYLMAFSCAKLIDHRNSDRLTFSRMHVYSDMENFKKRLSGIWEISYTYN